MTNNHHICKNLIMLAAIICSYIGLILYISGESSLAGSSNLPEHTAIDVEMMNQSLPVQDADFSEIQINKHIINFN